MLPCRQSILNRRPRSAIAYAKNEENIDKEYHDQLELLKIQQEKYYMKEAEVKQRVSPNRDETRRRQQELKGCMEEQLKIKESERIRRAHEDHDLNCYNEYLSKFAPHSINHDMGRIQHKKDYLKQLMEDNIRVAEMKRELEKKEKQREIELDHIRAKTPCCWNRRHYI
ncbi:hypothetical protein SELMODRAFT_421755 [Selaginella moellendorffii]|uniref:Uncharacterized protein n=1 Tax=Selaginella moellendorffii TaxID=88036 RepID=D8SG96_SELML|nr:uncharacterized protein LOC9636220 [Selaginella moellendorffii]EFJ16650.1 hypothetical protein SELMODRAFT_421755 [Selaginella moellendorffii]|eukprot:XP_002982405.1 uncharacterized protein LOC9636220 [Selaginella moellendorffii]